MKPLFTTQEAAFVLQRYLKCPVRRWFGDCRVRCRICRQHMVEGGAYLAHSSSARTRNEVIHSACFDEGWRRAGLEQLRADIRRLQNYVAQKRKLLDVSIAWLERNRRDLRRLRRLNQGIAKGAAEARWGKRAPVAK